LDEKHSPTRATSEDQKSSRITCCFGVCLKRETALALPLILCCASTGASRDGWRGGGFISFSSIVRERHRHVLLILILPSYISQVRGGMAEITRQLTSLFGLCSNQFESGHEPRLF
jgi:hypothetical protein